MLNRVLPACVLVVVVSQAWNDENLMQLSEKITSHLLFAHVRAATPGSVVAERLCHPFR